MEDWKSGKIEWNFGNHKYFSLPHRAYAVLLFDLGRYLHNEAKLHNEGKRKRRSVWGHNSLMVQVWNEVVIPQVLRQTQDLLTASQKFLDACGMTGMSLNELKREVTAKSRSKLTGAHFQGMVHLITTGAMSIQKLEYATRSIYSTDSSHDSSR